MPLFPIHRYTRIRRICRRSTSLDEQNKAALIRGKISLKPRTNCAALWKRDRATQRSTKKDPKWILILGDSNQNLIGRLRRMMHEGARRPTWMKLLKKATDVINETANDVTGSPPAKLWAMGRLEAEVISEVRQARSRARQKTCARQQKTSEGRSPPFCLLFQAGESVWLRDHVRMGRLDEKFAPFWKGPYPVNRAISNHLRELQCGSRSLIVYVDSLREVQHREACENE